MGVYRFLEREEVMHVDKYVVNNIGTKWTNGKLRRIKY